MSHLGPERIEELAAAASVADAHLDGCAECKRALTSAQARRKLLKGLKDVTLTDAAFRRVEAKMMGELEARPVEGWGLVRYGLLNGWLAFGALALLLALVVVPKLLEPRAEPQKVAVRERLPAPAPAREVSLVAVLVEGAVLHNGTPLVAGEKVVTGDRLDTQRGRVVLAQAGQALKVELSGVAQFGGAATVALGSGTLAVDAASEVLVEAAGAWVSGTDAAFVVSRAAAEVVVDVLRGSVRMDSDSEFRDPVSLVALAHVQLPVPVKKPFPVASAEPVAYPYAPIPKEPWARLDVNDLPTGASFDVEGQHFGGTPASLLLTEGRYRLKVHVPGQGTREAWVKLVAGSDTKFVLPPLIHQDQDPEPTEAAIAQLQRALLEQRPKLSVCYEKWLKANPTAGGRIELTLVVAKDGKVKSARASSVSVSPESADCLMRTAKTLRLPALGSEQEVVVPLRMMNEAAP